MGPRSISTQEERVPLNKVTGTVGDDSQAAILSSEAWPCSPPSCSLKCQSWRSSPGAGLQSPRSNHSPTPFPAAWVITIAMIRNSVLFNGCPTWEAPDFSLSAFLQNSTCRFWASVLNPTIELFPLFFQGGKRSLSPSLSPRTCEGC